MQQSAEHRHTPPINWLAAIVLIATPLAALILVPWYALAYGFTVGHWVAFAVVLACNGFSITAGYHRLWAHRTYKARAPLRWFFALFGAGATQNSILVWCSGHRRHHRHVDDDDRDPYSAGRGFWFSHIGWMLRQWPAGKDDFSNAADLERDPIVRFQHRHYLPLAITMNLLPAVVAGLLFGNLGGYLLLAGLLRLVVNHHVTFLINSLAHCWGRQPYTDANSARDNVWLALLTYGEGYHNFHHRFQNDYRNGLRWWHFDPTKWLIRTAAWLGLAHDLNRVEDFRIQRALLDQQFKLAQAKLDKTRNADAWGELVEREYQQFLASLAEWKALRQQWYEAKRQAWAERTAELHRRWHQTAIAARLEELEYSLKLQHKRLRYLTMQMN